MTKVQSPALKVLDKMIETATFLRASHRSDHVKVEMIGELTNELSLKDREMIQQLKSEEIVDRNSPYVYYRDKC